jgi:histidinol-phosphatase (PHP family)
MPGLEPWLEELHSRDPLHYVIGSVHPQTPEYQDRYFNGDWVAFQHQYFTSLAEAAETGLFDCISHPDLVKNLAPEEYDLEGLKPTILKTLDRIAATGVAMELNTSGLLKTVPEMNPSLAILTEMNLREIPVVVGADAHIPERVAADYRMAYDLLNEASYHTVRYFKNREAVEIPISLARESLN